MDFMNWKGWWSSLFKQAFVVPIFLFFMYLILKFLNTGFMNEKLLKGSSWGTAILQVAVPLLLIAILLLQAKKIATSMSGVVAEYAMKAATFVGGVAGGAMLGVGALGLSKVAGATAGRLSSENMKDYASGVKGNKAQQWAARRAVSIGDFSKNSSFDLRKTQAGALLAKQSGFNFDNSVLSTMKIGTEDTKGGAFGRESRRKLAAEEKSKKYGFNQEKWKALDDAEKKNKEDYEKATDDYKTEDEKYEAMKKSGITGQTLDDQGKKVEAARKIKAHIGHEGHKIKDRKKVVENERQGYMTSKEKKKGAITQPRAVADVIAPKDMTLPDGTRILSGERILERGQKITNDHLKALIREYKNANVGQNDIKDLEENFVKQYRVKEFISVTTRDEGATTNNPNPVQYAAGSQLSPKQRNDLLAGMERAGASTAQLDFIKNRIGYINSSSAKFGEIAGKIGERALQGFAVDLASGFSTMGAGTLGGFGFGIAEVLSQMNRYSKGFQENLTWITDEARKQEKKSSGGGDHKAASTAAKPADDHGHGGH